MCKRRWLPNPQPIFPNFTLSRPPTRRLEYKYIILFLNTFHTPISIPSSTPTPSRCSITSRVCNGNHGYVPPPHLFSAGRFVEHQPKHPTKDCSQTKFIIPLIPCAATLPHHLAFVSAARLSESWIQKEPPCEAH